MIHVCKARQFFTCSYKPTSSYKQWTYMAIYSISLSHKKNRYTMETLRYFFHSTSGKENFIMLNSIEFVITKILLWYIYCDDRVCSLLIKAGRLPGLYVQINKSRLKMFFCTRLEQLLHFGEYKLYSFNSQHGFVPLLLCVCTTQSW